LAASWLDGVSDHRLHLITFGDVHDRRGHLAAVRARSFLIGGLDLNQLFGIQVCETDISPFIQECLTDGSADPCAAPVTMHERPVMFPMCSPLV